jgi:hypothetical protein
MGLAAFTDIGVYRFGAYKDFLSLGNDADPDTPILREAEAKHAKLR